MKKLPVSLLLMLFMISGKAYCHYSWIDFKNFLPSSGEETKIFLCNGHYYPRSEIAIKDRLISDTKIILPDRSTITFSTEKEKKLRSGSVLFKSTGTYIATFSLVKPPKKDPLFYAKSIITVGDSIEKEFSYELGQLFEIIPQKAVSSLKQGDSLPLKLVLMGKPLKTSLLVTVKPVKSIFKKNFTVMMDKEGMGIIKIKKSGRYLVTAEYKGKGCSLTFYVK